MSDSSPTSPSTPQAEATSAQAPAQDDSGLGTSDVQEGASSLAPIQGRLVSLDVFRGATIVGMILVNNPGSWEHVYPPLRHANWHGWTPTDLIFPFFLFIVGVAIPLAYTKRLARGISRTVLVQKALRRSVILFGIGVFMAAYPIVQIEPAFEWLRPGLGSLRIMGILQRIALCYLAATLLFLYTQPRTRLYWIGGVLLTYWGALELVPVPGYGTGMLDVPEATLPAYVDRMVLGTEHLWTGAEEMWDPEGLMSTLPAVVTTLLGVWTGRLLLRENTPPITKVARLFVVGTLLVVGGYVWNWGFPINKSLWTSSYVLLTGGQAMCALALCYWVVDLKGYQKWTHPFVVYGMNALIVFVLSTLVTKTLIHLQVTVEGEAISVHRYLYQTVFLPLVSPTNASLLYALVYIVLWYGVLAVMYRKNIVITV
jgi:predicted acyltransferase